MSSVPNVFPDLVRSHFVSTRKKTVKNPKLSAMLMLHKNSQKRGAGMRWEAHARQGSHRTAAVQRTDPNQPFHSLSNNVF